VLLRVSDEFNCAKDITVIGHRHGGHAKLLHAITELFDVACTIKERVVSMQVEVNELGHGLSLILTVRRRTAQPRFFHSRWKSWLFRASAAQESSRLVKISDSSVGREV
jgi:hypothetical protein